MCAASAFSKKFFLKNGGGGEDILKNMRVIMRLSMPHEDPPGGEGAKSGFVA